MREFRLVLIAILRSKTSAVLITFQLAISLSFVVNSFAAIVNQIERSSRDSGIEFEENVFTVQSVGFVQNFDASSTITEDLIRIRSLDNVVSAYATNAVPFSGSGNSSSFASSLEDDAVNASAATYQVDEGIWETLGLTLLYGRQFENVDVEREADKPSVAVITQSFAEALFPGLSLDAVVGNVVYTTDGTEQHVIGIIKDLHAPWSGDSIVFRSVLYPQLVRSNAVNYVIRAESGMLSNVMQNVVDELAESNLGRVVQTPWSLADLRKQSYAYNVIVWVLSVTIGILLIITGCGIVGVTSFTVQKQTKQIGARRAVGATVLDIASYYLLQFSIVCLIGMVIGVALAIGINMLFIGASGFPQLSTSDLLVGLALVGTSTMAGVCVPAIRASKIDPAIALRSV